MCLLVGHVRITLLVTSLRRYCVLIMKTPTENENNTIMIFMIIIYIQIKEYYKAWIKIYMGYIFTGS